MPADARRRTVESRRTRIVSALTGLLLTSVVLSACSAAEDDAQERGRTGAELAPEEGAATETDGPRGLDAFPHAGTTGVPAGVELQPSDGLEVTEDGAVLDALHVTGSIRVRANDVTISRSLIDNSGRYPIQLEPGFRNLVVEDTEIDGNNTGQPDLGSTAILSAEYTLRRVNIHSVLDGPRIEGDNVLIEDSYIHSLSRSEGGHHDTIQIRQGSNIVIRNNNLQAFNAETDDMMNAAIQIGSLIGPLTDLRVEGNLMNGGNYTINASKAGEEPIHFRDNVFQRDFRYGVLSSGPAVDFDESNVWLDDGTPITH